MLHTYPTAINLQLKEKEKEMILFSARNTNWALILCAYMRVRACACVRVRACVRAYPRCVRVASLLLSRVLAYCSVWACKYCVAVSAECLVGLSIIYYVCA